VAAIKPHLAQEGENTALQRDYWRCAGGGGLSGLGDEVCPAPEEIAQEAHAELMNVSWIRQALIEKMAGRKIWIEYDSDGMPAIAIDKPVGGPAWNPSSGSKATTILGWTTKMGAPSFSLPAGADAMGGACPGATAGQSIVPLKVRKTAANKVLQVLNDNPRITAHGGGRETRENPEVQSVNITKTVCEFCYAEGGQYATSGVQNAQLMRFAWALRAIRRTGHATGVSEFYSVMLDAIDRADWKSHEEPEHFRPKRFFRIHDSGDFFHLDYLREWKKIALYYHPTVGGEGLSFREDGSIARFGRGHPEPVWFWAPSRIWAVGKPHAVAVSEINEKYGDNFSIRPSAYHINQNGPFLSGWAAPSTVYDHKHKPQGQGSAFDWDCKAYAVEKGPSCRGAKNPEGQVGCRACWLHQDSAVNYTLHL
jgi:hypothetical protein